MNGLLGAQLGAQSGMTSNGVMGYADLIRKKLMETLAPKTAEEIKSETPQPTAPKDYTAGLTPPEIGGVPSKLEFKATPNRLSAFMVALGNIMQNKYNTERAKEEQAQGLYESKLKAGQAMNQFQTELGMKEAAEARDPYRKAQIQKIEQDIAMGPLEAKIKEASLANMLKRGAQIGKTKSGSAGLSAADSSKMTDEELVSITGFTPEELKYYRSAPPKIQTQIMKPYMTKIERVLNPDTKLFYDLQKPVSEGGEGLTAVQAKERVKKLGRQTPEERGAAAYQTQKEGIKGAIAGAKEAGGQPAETSSPQPKATAPKEEIRYKLINGKQVPFKKTAEGWVQQ